MVDCTEPVITSITVKVAISLRVDGRLKLSAIMSTGAVLLKLQPMLANINSKIIVCVCIYLGMPYRKELGSFRVCYIYAFL